MGTDDGKPKSEVRMKRCQQCRTTKDVESFRLTRKGKRYEVCINCEARHAAILGDTSDQRKSQSGRTSGFMRHVCESD